MSSEPEPVRLPVKPERDYTPEQQVALKGLAQLLATAIQRKVDAASGHVKSAKPQGPRT